MIKEQNYIKIAEYTKKAFQLFCKRRLASEILQILGRPKVKKDFICTESQLGLQNDSVIDSQLDKKLQQSQPKTSNMRFAKQTAYLKQNLTETYITKIRYGDFVSLQIKTERGISRMTLVLDDLKLFHNGDLVTNIVIEKKSCFQICSPYTNHREMGEVITSQSMLCLRNVFNGLYLQLTDTPATKKQFGYAVTFQPQIKKEAIIRLISCKVSDKTISTDQQILISSYFTNQLYLTITQQSLDAHLSEKSVIASYSASRFRIFKSKNIDWKSPSYYYLHCPPIKSNVTAQEILFNSKVIRKEFSNLQIDNGYMKKQVNSESTWNFYQIGSEKQAREVHIEQVNQNSLFQIWELQRSQNNDGGCVCRIRNVATNQPLIPQPQEMADLPAYSKRNSVLQIKKWQGNEYSIFNQQNVSLAAVYDNEKDKYVLSFDYDIHHSHFSNMGRNSIYQFELIELPQYKCHILTHLVKAFYFLKYNYQFFEKWGWSYDERAQKVKYSVTELKIGLKLIRQKIREVQNIIQRTVDMMSTYENHKAMFQDMAQQIHILELFILYSKIINMKMGSKRDRTNQTYFIAHEEFHSIHEKICEILFLLVENNRKNSQIIIQRSQFFNYLLSLYPDTVGALLQEAINNLCLLTNNKTNKEEHFIREWAELIKFIINAQELDIQRKFIDILSEVAVDPWDIGITHYQHKIREQLFIRAKKKIFPKFMIKSEGVYPIAFICFQYIDFPDPTDNQEMGYERKFYQLKQFKNYQSHLKYVCSILRLLRNLCKDRNKKMPKIVQEYGLTQHFFNNIFTHTEIGWELIVRFLDLYCSMYLIQDPFLPFEKRQVKCFFSQKIKYLDFQTKTSLLFKQFTEQNATQQKHKQFDLYIITFLNTYFRAVSDLDSSSVAQGGEYFSVLVTILFSFINYGYLNEREIRKYVSCVISQAKRIFQSEECSKKVKNELLRKTLQLCELAQQVCTSIHGMNILKQIYQSLEHERMITAEKIKNIMKSALEDERKIYELQIDRKRKISTLKRSDKYIKQHSEVEYQGELKSLKLQEFGSGLIVTNSNWMNSECQMKIMSLLQLVSERGEHICHFLDEVLILNTEQEEAEFLEYSGITPRQIIHDKNSDTSNSSNRLLNVMKVKQLIQKISQQGMTKGDESNKNQKILQLNNLLMKIIYNLQNHKKKNYTVFAKCQVLLQKLNLHSILIDILKYQEFNNFQEIINNIINFYCEFVENNETNLTLMVRYFRELTKRYSFKKLPILLPQLFIKSKNHEEAFWMVYNNIDKKMDNEHKEILFQCIYNILKKCPEELFQKIKGTLLYSLTSYKQFRKIIRVQDNYKFPHFIKLVCLVGKAMPATYRTISQMITRDELLQGIQCIQSDYGLKWIYLRIYAFLFIESGVQFDENERQMLVKQIFKKELQYLPPSFRGKAERAAQQSRERVNRGSQKESDEQQIKTEFSKLMTTSNLNMPASIEQAYLMYLLNMNDASEFSMLNCLHLVLQKYTISNYTIEMLGKYLSQMINFMNKIYLKEDRTFQSRILASLISINELIRQKYNRYSYSVEKYTYSQRYEIVESFYYKLAQLIRRENLSFSQICKCMGVGYGELNEVRENKNEKKLIRQGEFSGLIKKLGDFVNNRSVFTDKITEGSIKTFFEMVKEKQTNKIDLLGFLSKLFDVLQNQKVLEISQKVNEKRNSQDLYESMSRKKDQKQGKHLNSELITRQIEEFKKVFNLRLKSAMLQKIKEHVLSAILEQQKKSEDWYCCKIGNMFQLLIIGQKYPISTFTIQIILKKIKKKNYLYDIAQKLRDKFIKFLLKKLEHSFDNKMIGIIIEIYSHHKEHWQIASSIEIAALKLCEETSALSQVNLENNEGYLKYLDKFYILFSSFMVRSNCTTQIREAIQKHISALFIKYYHQFFITQKSESFNFCVMLLQKMIQIFDSFDKIAQSLAKNDEFIAQNAQIIKKYLKNGIFCTNYKNQKYSKLIYKLCELMIKMRARHICFPLIEITHSWPFQQILTTFKRSYSSSLSQKIERGLKCRRDQTCSLQFCNDQEITSFDSDAIENISSLVIVIQIVSELESNEFSKNPQNSDALNLFRDWRNGKTSDLRKQDEKMLQVVQKIQIKANNKQKCNIYFSLPMMNKFRKPEFEQELNEQIAVFKKQNFFENLDHFSFLVQKELQSHQEGHYGFLQRNYKSITQILQILFIIYLFLLCLFSLLTLDGIPKPVMYFFNSLILILKCGMFARDFRKFMNEKKTLVNITYEKNVMFWKFNWIIASFVVIVCYCVVYAAEFIIPVVLLLEAYQIKDFSEVITVSLPAFKHSAVYLSIISIFILAYSFILFGQNYSDSIFQIFIELQKEIILYSSINISADDDTSFPALKQYPMLIPAINLALIFGTSIFVSSLVHSLFKNQQEKTKNEQSCKICHCMKSYCEERNINYEQHITKDHSPWTYIYFFIYMRRQPAKGPLFRKLKESIEIENFEFLRNNLEELT